MDVIECIKNRRSYRKFSDKKLEYDVIEELIELATFAPTAQYKQPWGFLVIQDKDEIKRLSDLGKVDIMKNIDNLPHFKAYEDWFKDPDFNLFYEAENLVVIYSDKKNSAWYKEDAALAAENMILAGLSKGIGSCWIGFGEYIFERPEVKEKYNIPDEFVTVAPLIFGYIEKESKPPKRKSALIFGKTEDK